MTDKPARQTRTPEQRAEEALAVADRRVARLTTEKGVHVKAMGAVDAALIVAKERRDYLAKDPALAADKPKPVESVSSVGPADKGQVLMNEADSG